MEMSGHPKRMMRLVASGVPLLWGRVDADYCGYSSLRSAEGLSAHSILAPIPFEDARRHASTDPMEGSRTWARAFAKELLLSPTSPLWNGPMFVGPTPGFLGNARPRVRTTGRIAVPAAVGLGDVPTLPGHGSTEWDFGDPLPPLPLRTLSSETSARVKAYRKLVREGCLPPLVLLWITGFDRYVILDGHDRLLAALLEGKAPPCMAVLGLSEHGYPKDTKRNAAMVAQIERSLALAQKPIEGTRPRRGFTIDDANRLLVEAFDDRPCLYLATRAWPLAAGTASWCTEVREELRRAGVGESSLLA